MTSPSRSQRPEPPVWFTTLIQEGLASLYLLGLEGCPAADTAPAVCGLWSRALWDNPKRDWYEAADTACIRAAFASIVGSSHRWPTPAKFWDHLPSRAEPSDRLLAERTSSTRREVLEAERRWRQDLGLPEIGHA